MSSRLRAHRYYVVICERGELCEQQALCKSFCKRGELATAREQLRGHGIRKTRRKSSESTEENSDSACCVPLRSSARTRTGFLPKKRYIICITP